MLGNQVGVGGRGDWGWGCVNRRHLPLPSLSCRSLYGPCLGSASVNHVDHPGPIIISAVSQVESASLSRFSHRLCVVSFACAVPSWKPPGTGLVVCVHPVPPTAVALRPRGQYRGEGPLASLVGAVALAVGLAPSWLVSLMDACKFAYWVLRLPRYQKPESPTYLLGLSITLQYYRY